MASISPRVKRYLISQIFGDYNAFRKAMEGIMVLPEIPSNIRNDLWKLQMFVGYQNARVLGGLVGYRASEIPSRKWYAEMREEQKRAQLESIFRIRK